MTNYFFQSRSILGIRSSSIREKLVVKKLFPFAKMAYTQGNEKNTYEKKTALTLTRLCLCAGWPGHVRFPLSSTQLQRKAIKRLATFALDSNTYPLNWQ